MKKTFDFAILALVISISFCAAGCGTDTPTPPPIPDKYADVIGHGCTEALYVREWDSTTGELIHDDTLPAPAAWTDTDKVGYGPCTVTVDGVSYPRKTLVGSLLPDGHTYLTISVPDPVCDTLRGYICDTE